MSCNNLYILNYETDSRIRAFSSLSAYSSY